VIVPSESEEPEALKLTARGAIPEAGDVVKLAVGGTLATGGIGTAVAWIVAFAVSVAPLLSLTISHTS
jgi:hypothetical protein